MMNKILQKSLYTATCLSVGFSIGFNFSDDIAITETRVHDGKYVDDVSQVEFYDSMIQNVNVIEIYDTSELTPQVMASRSGKIIVEKVIGRVTSDALGGEILNCNVNDGGYGNKDGGNYISYERVDGVKKGDKIVTYFIYNPFNNEQDDVMTRLDFIIDDNSI